MTASETADLIVVGAGAAGLATAIFCRRAAPHLRVVCVDGARTLGAKILVSGGGRCNVTNRVVTERDFWGGSPTFVRHVLRAFSAEDAVSFFKEIGVALHEEEDGKLFPDSDRARTVLEALLAAAARTGVDVRPGRRVVAIEKNDVFDLEIDADVSYRARAVVLATGGLSLPKSGSDGLGYRLAISLGHTIVDTTPALVPLLLDPGPYLTLSGVAHRAAVIVSCGGQPVFSTEGSLLWTHFGISGPLALDASRHWLRVRGESADVSLMLNLCPGDTFDALERWFIAQRRERPRALVLTVLGSRLPASVAAVWLERAGIAADLKIAQLDKAGRRRLVRGLLSTSLEIRASRGYNYAEVTAGGVTLSDVSASTLESRVCPRLYFAGEILDVDGRLGGFNFQWAWSSGWVAGRAAAKALATHP